MSDERCLPPELLRAIRLQDAHFRAEHATGSYSVKWNYKDGKLEVAQIVTPTYEFKFSEQLTHP